MIFASMFIYFGFKKIMFLYFNKKIKFRVDFEIIRGQADWVSDCDSSLVLSIESDFKENLRLQRNLDEWTEWLEAVVDQVLAKYHDKPIDVQIQVSKQYLLKWSFYR